MHNIQSAMMQGLLGAEVTMAFADSRIAPAQTWEIYRRNYMENHIAALADTYSGVRDLVGEAYFRQLARAYVPTEISRSADLNAYGAGFPLFLERELGSLPSGDQLPYLADMARLDWAAFQLMCSESASDRWYAQLQSIAEQDWPRMKIDAAATCLCSAYPIGDIWRMQQGEAIDINLSQAQALLLTYRADTARGLHLQVVAHREAMFLSHWFSGKSLEQALESTLSTELDDVNEELDVLMMLQGLAQAQAIRHLYLE